MKRAFDKLSEKEILALAIQLEEDDQRTYADLADALKDDFAATAGVFQEMAAEEAGHHQRLLEKFRAHFGDHVPTIRRQEVRGFLERKPVWLIQPLNLTNIRHQIEVMELESQRFYAKAAARANDPGIRQLLEELEAEECRHEEKAMELEKAKVTPEVRETEDRAARRLFVLQVVQPGLAGLMDGSVSTLAPVFAAAFATQDTWQTFLVGLAASVGAGISMGFAEALSDDGSLSGRGRPYVRGVVCGAMTALGGIGHTLPFLIGNFLLATLVAAGVVIIELAVISWIRHRYMDTPIAAAAVQVFVGGLLVFGAGVLIGSS